MRTLTRKDIQDLIASCTAKSTRESWKKKDMLKFAPLQFSDISVNSADTLFYKCREYTYITNNGKYYGWLRENSWIAQAAAIISVTNPRWARFKLMCMDAPVSPSVNRKDTEYVIPRLFVLYLPFFFKKKHKTAKHAKKKNENEGRRLRQLRTSAAASTMR